MAQFTISVLMIVNIGLTVMLGFIALYPAQTRDPDWQTLAIWRDGQYRMIGMQWFPGALTKDDIEKLPNPPFQDSKLMETFTVPGRPMDAGWVKSVNGAAPL